MVTMQDFFKHARWNTASNGSRVADPLSVHLHPAYVANFQSHYGYRPLLGLRLLCLVFELFFGLLEGPLRTRRP
jgi:hypothetical protein